MRQRRLKNLDEKLNIYSGGIKIRPVLMKGIWNRQFSDPESPLYMELGCGKGQFIKARAAANPGINYLAVEGNRSVMLRALQKTADMKKDNSRNMSAAPEESIFTDAVNTSDGSSAVKYQPEPSPYRTSDDDCIYRATPNLIFANMYLRNVTDMLEEGELSGIYLNFSDPWPKKRQAKRRLTHRRYLEGYRQALKPGSFLEFKTDNRELFMFSVDEFMAFGLELTEYSEDLHGGGRFYESADFTTEYEERFVAERKRIYYCKIRF